MRIAPSVRTGRVNHAPYLDTMFRVVRRFSQEQFQSSDSHRPDVALLIVPCHLLHDFRGHPIQGTCHCPHLFLAVSTLHQPVEFSNMHPSDTERMLHPFHHTEPAYAPVTVPKVRELDNSLTIDKEVARLDVPASHDQRNGLSTQDPAIRHRKIERGLGHNRRLQGLSAPIAAIRHREKERGFVMQQTAKHEERMQTGEFLH